MNKILSEAFIKGSKKYSFNDTYFENINTPEKAYWLGYIYTDGNIASYDNKKRLSLRCKSTDEEILQNFIKSIESNHIIYHGTQKNKGYDKIYSSSVLRISSSKLFEDLQKQGIRERKTYRDVFPTNISPEFLSNYIRGCIDGDGCIIIYRSENRIKTEVILAGRKQFLEWCKNETIKQIDINRGISKHTSKNGELYKWKIGGRLQFIKFLDWLYKDATICLTRKFNIWKEYINTNKRNVYETA